MGYFPLHFSHAHWLGDNNNKISFLELREQNCMLRKASSSYNFWTIWWMRNKLCDLSQCVLRSLCYNNSTYTTNKPLVMKPIGDFGAAAKIAFGRKIRSAVAHIYSYLFEEWLLYVYVFSYLLQTEKIIIFYKL